MRTQSLLNGALAVMLTANAAEPLKAQARVVNTNCRPAPGECKLFLVANITDQDTGGAFAGLYMTSKEMTYDATGPLSGAGYYEAAQGKKYFISFFSSKGLFRLYVDRVEWDDSGKTIAIKGLSRLEGLRSSGGKKVDIEITSEPQRFRVVNGVLYLRLPGYKREEFKFKIRFGNGVSVDSEDFY